MMLESAKSEHPQLTNRKITFEEFQPMWSRYLNVTDRQRRTDGRRDRRTTCRRSTALCVSSRSKNKAT